MRVKEGVHRIMRADRTGRAIGWTSFTLRWETLELTSSKFFQTWTARNTKTESLGFQETPNTATTIATTKRVKGGTESRESSMRGRWSSLTGWRRSRKSWRLSSLQGRMLRKESSKTGPLRLGMKRKQKEREGKSEDELIVVNGTWHVLIDINLVFISLILSIC